jgi:ABC-2 type transport system ATP-binding protein
VTAEGRPVRPRKSHGAKRTSRIGSDAAVTTEPGLRGSGRIRSQPPIRTRGLTKQYGELTAVDKLDLEVQAGEIFGLLGQNGAGKTTTILMLLGLTEPTAGAARVVGLDPARHPLEVKRRVGYMPDSVGFYPDLTGRRNLRYTARLNGMRGPSAESKIDEVLEQVRLTDRADSRTDTYSRGMLQRLGIADALVKDPEVLILDEPTAAIDPIGVVEILDLLRGLVRDRGLAILLSSHLLNQVQSVCDRVGIFAAGKLIGNGTVPDLARRFGDSSARVEAAFEAADNPVEGDRIERILRSIDGVVDVTRSHMPDDPWEVVVRPPDASTRVREAILAASASEGLRLTSLRSAVPSLDDIYRKALEQTGLASDASATRAVA